MDGRRTEVTPSHSVLSGERNAEKAVSQMKHVHWDVYMQASLM